MPQYEIPVLIVGGSLVGLSSALLLGHYGVRSLTVEHHRGTAIHPRAAQISQRTMEIFRTVGVEPLVRQKSAEQFVQDGAIMAVETLDGREIGYFIANLNEGVRDVSPSERVFISQSLLEPLLRARAEAFGAELRFGTEMVSFEQDSTGVTAVVRHRDSDETDIVRASYMIAADGAHSGIRKRLDIPMRGHGVFSHSITIHFRADIAPLLRGRNLSVVYVNNRVLRGFFRFEKPFDRGFLAVNAIGPPDKPVTDVSTGLTEERCLDLIRAALGVHDIPITVETVMTWSAAADIASRYQQGRVFLAGGAAHVMPPNGGFGGNTGVQDAHNLAWKLSAVLTGAARPELLATYETERRPVGEFTVEQAYARYVTRTAPSLGTGGIQPIEEDLHIELGYGYRSRAVCDSAGGTAPLHDDPRHTKGRPGTRAPHVWLRRDGDEISTLDLFGSKFVLLAATDGQGWSDSARHAAMQREVDVDVHLLEDRVIGGADAFFDAYGIGPGGAVLVRPDGFVGWRSVGPIDGDAAARTTALARALTTLTCRDL